MHIKTQGLVLRQTNYQDHDLLLTVLTKDYGRMTLRARGVKGKRSKLKSGCQLLAYSELTIFENRGFCTVQEAEPLELFMLLRSDLERLSLASYFTQVAELLSQEDMPNPELLALTLNCLYALCKLQRPQRQIKAVFELSAACLAGYMPELSGCGICGREEASFFCLQQGTLRCRNCLQHDDGLRMPVSAGTLAALRYICFADRRRVLQFQVTDAVMQQLDNLTEAYLAVQLEHSFSTLDFYKSICHTT